MGIILDKHKINIGQYANIKMNSTFWFVLSLIIFCIAMWLVLRNTYVIYEFKKDINMFYNFENNDLPLIKNILEKDTNAYMLDSFNTKLLNIKNSLPSISNIYMAVTNSYNKNQIILDNIRRSKDIVSISGMASNLQSYSITSVMKFIENLKTYDFFDVFYLSNINKNVMDGVSKSKFSFDITLKPVSQSFKYYTGNNAINIDLYDLEKPSAVQNLIYSVYNVNNQNVIDIKWDMVLDNNFEAFLIYKGNSSTDLKLYDVSYQPNFIYTTVDYNENCVFQIFVLNKNFNISEGSQIIEINSANIIKYNQINPIKVYNEKIKNENGILVNVFNISWNKQNILPTQNYIILYSIDNKKYYLAGKTKDTVFQFSTVDISDKYYFAVVYQAQ